MELEWSGGCIQYEGEQHENFNFLRICTIADHSLRYAGNFSQKSTHINSALPN